MKLCKTTDTWNAAIFDPRAIIWIYLGGVYYMKIHNIKGLGCLVSDKKIFKVFALCVYVKQVTPRGWIIFYHRALIWTILVAVYMLKLHTK